MLGIPIFMPISIFIPGIPIFMPIFIFIPGMPIFISPSRDASPVTSTREEN